MSNATYDKYNGILGHKHVPENDHWDPGAFDWRKLLEGGSVALTEAEADLLVDRLMARRIWSTPGYQGEEGSPLEVIISRDHRNTNELIYAHRADQLGTDDPDIDHEAIADAIAADLVERGIGEIVVAALDRALGPE